MPRQSRTVIPGALHHITQRGNLRQQVFFANADYQAFLYLLRMYTRRQDLPIIGYCLMSNHIHLGVIPAQENHLSLCCSRLFGEYAQRMHYRSGVKGHFWEDRFASIPVAEEGNWRVVRYIERNPVRAGLVRYAWEYPWSSAAARIQGQDPFKLLNLTIWNECWNASSWREYIGEDEDLADLLYIRQMLNLSVNCPHG